MKTSGEFFSELRVESLEFRFGVSACGHIFILLRRGIVWLTQFTDSVVGASIARPCGLPVTSHYPDGWPPQKPSPRGGRWRGTRRMRGTCPAAATNQPVLLQLPQSSPSSVTYGDSFPQRGKPPCGMTRTGISRGLSKAPPELCLRTAVRRPVRFLVRKQKNSSS